MENLFKNRESEQKQNSQDWVKKIIKTLGYTLESVNLSSVSFETESLLFLNDILNSKYSKFKQRRKHNEYIN